MKMVLNFEQNRTGHGKEQNKTEQGTEKNRTEQNKIQTGKGYRTE